MNTRYFKHRLEFADGTDYISNCDGVTIAHNHSGWTMNISATWPLEKLLRFTEEGMLLEVSNPKVVDLKKVKKVARRWRKIPMTDVRLVFRHRTVAVNDLDEADFRISDILRVEIKS